MQLIKFLLREFHLFIIFFKCYNEFGRCWELILFFFHVRFCVLVYLDIYSLLCYLFLSLFFFTFSFNYHYWNMLYNIKFIKYTW